MMLRDLKISVRDDLSPLCPYCEQPLDEVYVRSKGLGVVMPQSTLCFCPHCHKVLGFGQSRMM